MAKALIKSLLSKYKKPVKEMATGGKIDGMDALNAGLGISSLVSGLSNKKPAAMVAPEYHAMLRTPRGNQAAVDQSLGKVAQEKNSAIRDVNEATGGDVNKNIQARLGIQANATDANNQVIAKNTDLVHEQQKEYDQNYNNQEAFNTQTKQQTQSQNNQNERQDYYNTLGRAFTGAQSSLNYVADKDANTKNNAAKVKAFNTDLDIRDEAHKNDLEKELIRSGASPAEVEKRLGTGFVPRFKKYKVPEV